jgi:sugar phosphate isomerase/epimerase
MTMRSDAAAMAAAFKTSAPAMVFGHDIVENAEVLAGLVDNVEIVLFHTPTQNNFLSRTDIRRLAQVGRREEVSYTVHLPDSLEIASPAAATRTASVERTRELIGATADIAPRHYILHIPYSPPALVPVPGGYLKSIDSRKWQDWLKRAGDSLAAITGTCDPSVKLLAENINYSLSFLEPLVRQGFCQFCLDVGHLLLGQESVMAQMRHHFCEIEEVHLHGIRNHRDHFSLACLPQDRLARWLDYLHRQRFNGVVNLEVFSPEDLKVSLALLGRFSVLQPR